MPPFKPKLGKKIVHSQAREVISNVCKFMESEKNEMCIRDRPNTTSLVQPLDMGIIKHFKSIYRGKLVNHI